jgi:hypothetical protein
MPYIKQEQRDALNTGLIDNLQINNAGELNYLFTRIAKRYLLTRGLNYQHINDIIGALEGAKLELYRRVTSPYEDIKIKENGDIYDNINRN